MKPVDPAPCIELPLMNPETKKTWEYKALIGEAKDIDILNNHKDHLEVLCFKSPVEAEEFRFNKVEDWEKWFSRLYISEGIPPIFERVAWIKILGVPMSLWDRHVINKIGEKVGRLLVKSEAESSDRNMAEDRLAVLVQTGKRISAEFTLKWKDHSIQVWVEEISGQWYPEFLNSAVTESESMGSDKDVDMSPRRSSEVGQSPLKSCSTSKSCMWNNQCMGNTVDGSLSKGEGNVHVKSTEVGPELFSPVYMEDREDVGSQYLGKIV
ncbi:hypothetical protein Hanom_Chr10g00904661 [Helianthus anomalus]